MSVAAGEPAEGVTPSADEVRSQVVGSTLARRDAAYVFLRTDGTVVLGSADPVVGPDTGFRRLDEAGTYCAWWTRVGRDREICAPATRRGGVHEFAGTEFSVIEGNPFRL